MLKLYNQHHEIINYLIFGVLTTVISLMTYYGLTITILNPKIKIELQIANILSWLVGVLFAYFTNRKFVFYSTNQNKKKEFFTFVSARVSTLILDMLVMFIGVSFLYFNDKIVKLISQVLVIIGNYVLSKIIVFKKDSYEESCK